MVGVTGFEPATSSSRTKRATKLRHTPVALSGLNKDSRKNPAARPRAYAAGTSVSSVASGGHAKRTGA